MGALLSNKNAVIYGAGGAIGGAVARAFAREGATVFLTGRGLKEVESVADEIRAAGGKAEAAEVDALDEAAIDKHLSDMVAKAGSVDISFNAISIPDAKILGVPLVKLDVEQFSLPITAYTTSYFLTARLAARHMIPNKSGVIMTVTALPSRMGSRLNGGYGPAQAAKEAMTRDLSAELAPQGIRVVGLRAQGTAHRHDLGTVPRVPRRHDPPATGHDARGDGKHGGLHGVRKGERDDGNYRQPDHGQPG